MFDSTNLVTILSAREEKKMDSLLQVMYAGSVAATQFIMTFAQVRAQQKAVSDMSEKQVQDLLNEGGGVRRPIGFHSSQPT